MASDSEPEAPRLNGVAGDEDDQHHLHQDMQHIEDIASPVEPSTPQAAAPPASSQLTLPSTEVPRSPSDGGHSFKTELNDDRNAATVIPSSLTPPPSTQVPPHNAVLNNGLRRGYSQSQQSNLFSPPATVLAPGRDRDANVLLDYVPPTPQQVLEAPADELRALLQTCIAEQQKLKMETAHHKLQYSLLSLQADEESKRAAVEHDMVRREVDALRVAEHARQARRELNTVSDASHAKYLRIKSWYDAAVEENDALHHRVKLAKKVIQQKDDEAMSLVEERDMLLTRIRENREHFHMLCSPGGIFHGALTPRQQALASPQHVRATTRQNPRSSQLDTLGDREHGLSALLQAMSQDNNSAPSTPVTPHRADPRQTSKRHRHAQSLSSLPTTPANRARGEHAGLLPSIDLVPQTEPPPHRYSTRHFAPSTPTPKADRRPRSRESTISVDDNEELARQALESAAAVQSFTSQTSRTSQRGRRADGDEEEIFDSQASQAATEMLRRDPRESFEVASSMGSRGGTPPATEQSARMQAKLFSSLKGAADKRKFSGGHGSSSGEEARREQGSPSKKLRVGAALADSPRVGLGIQYSQ